MVTAADAACKHTEKPPCAHNEWDNIRFKNMVVTLRCRVCREQWKTLNVSLRKCAAFYERKCPNGPSCPLTHIHRYKRAREMCVKNLNAINLSEAGDCTPDSTECDGQHHVPSVHSSSNRDSPSNSSRSEDGESEFLVPPPHDKDSIWAPSIWTEEKSSWDSWSDGFRSEMSTRCMSWSGI
ncbi:hypothetical protein DIPPA_21394 [Diplonema papillatum]|nr:hypothetical protein DIPPA_21394 [Diplonema papillatum]